MLNEKTRIAVFVSGGGTNLQALLDARDAGKLPHGEIVAVISSSRFAYALERAKKAGVPACVVNLKKAGSQAAYEEQLDRVLKEYRAEMIVMAGFFNIVSPDFISRWPRRVLNIHPSLLPSFGGDGFYGLRVHEAALRRGVKLTGATVHFVNEITDGGEILLQKAVEVRPDDTPETLQRRVMEEAEWILLPQAVEQVAAELAAEKEKNP